HGGGDGHVFGAPQESRDIGVVQVAMLGVKSHVIVTGPREFLRRNQRRAGNPATPDRGLPVAAEDAHSAIAILTRSGSGRQANSNAACTSSMPKVCVR